MAAPPRRGWGCDDGGYSSSRLGTVEGWGFQADFGSRVRGLSLWLWLAGPQPPRNGAGGTRNWV